MWLKPMIALGIVLALWLAAGGAGAWRWSQPVPPARASQSIAAELDTGTVPSLPWPVGAQAAVGAQGVGVLAATAGAVPLPTASVAKIMTALVTLSERPLAPGDQGPEITIDSVDVAVFHQVVAQDGSAVPVVAGERLTEYQALQALLLPSANNIAITLARWVAGSSQAFVELMNARSRALGLAATRFADTSGFDPTTVSVPSDLVVLAEAAMNDRVFAEIVAEPSAVLPVAGRVSNVNTELGRDGVVGVKTGNSVAARAVYVVAARVEAAGAGPLLVFGAVQGLPTLAACFAAATALLDAVRARLAVRHLVGRGDLVGGYRSAWGGSAPIVAAADLDLLLWPGTPVHAHLIAPDVAAPRPAGAGAGRLVVAVAGQEYTVPVVAATRLDGPDRLWRLTRGESPPLP